jgi:hypothetical protein
LNTRCDHISYSPMRKIDRTFAVSHVHMCLVQGMYNRHGNSCEYSLLVDVACALIHMDSVFGTETVCNISFEFDVECV